MKQVRLVYAYLVLHVESEVGSKGLQLEAAVEVIQTEGVQGAGVQGVRETRLIAGDNLR